LSGAGKSTTARALVKLLQGRGSAVVLLDGDEVRAGVSKGLGFSKADRDLNVVRVAALARGAIETGHVAVAALISPYRAARARARELVGRDRFVEVFVDAPLDVCEARDAKGLYKKARRGEIVGLTGVDDPYEPPLSPDLTIDSATCTVDHNAGRIVELLVVRGLLREQ
jgi:adenylyl-sulfate kinase